MSKKKPGHQPQRFQQYQESEDKTGFYLKDYDYFFAYDKFGGWKDQYGNYYNKDGQPDDQFEVQFGPDADVEDDFQQQIPQSQKILQRISHNMTLLEKHHYKAPLRVNFEIFDFDQPPTTKKLFKDFSENHKVINVFYGQNHENDQDDQSSQNQSINSDLQQSSSEQQKQIKEELKIMQPLKKEQQKKQLTQKQQKKQQQKQQKKQQSKQQTKQQYKQGQTKQEQNKQQQKKEGQEQISQVKGYFVVKNVKAADELIHRQGIKQFGYDIIFKVEPLDKLLIDPLKKYELKKFATKFFAGDQKFYGITINKEGFEKKEDMRQYLKNNNISLDKVLKVLQKDNRKFPVAALSNDELERLKATKYKQKDIIIEQYNKGKQEQSQEKN